MRQAHFTAASAFLSGDSSWSTLFRNTLKRSASATGRSAGGVREDMNSLELNRRLMRKVIVQSPQLQGRLTREFSKAERTSSPFYLSVRAT